MEEILIMSKKYRLRKDLSTQHQGRTLYRVQLLEDINGYPKGSIGGYVENENNLSQDGGCWVSGDAKVYGDAIISGDVWVLEETKVFGDIVVVWNIWMNRNVYVCGNDTSLTVDILRTRLVLG
jgi:hypothetical protein